jgi:5'-nucleotidase
VALILVAACAAPVLGERLVIVYTNDVHLRLDRLASIERHVEAVRSRGDPVLLLDAGDAWHDFRVPLYAVWGADRMVEWMNRVGYDAMAPGNHDLYWGWPKVGDLLSRTAFPVVCANLVAIDCTPSPFLPSVRLVRGGLDVLVVGLGPLEHLPALDLPWLRPVDPVEALRREIESTSQSPDLVICLAHILVREAEGLARAVPGVDVFVTGHSHATTLTPRVVGDTLIVQSGAFGRYVGELTLDVSAGAARLLDHKLVPTESETAAATGRGLAILTQVLLAILAFSIALAL